MAQQPSLTAASLTNQRDDVAAEVFGVTGYSSLSGIKQTELTAEGNAAFYEITQWARWYTEISPDATDLGSEWNEAFRQVWVAKAKRRFRSVQDYYVHWQSYVAPLLQRIADHYTADWNTATTQADDSISVQAIARSVIAICVRQRTPIFPIILQLHTIIREEFVKLWNMRKWEFRKRNVTVTINADGTMTVPSSYIFDGMASKFFVIRESSGARSKVHWIDASREADKAAKYSGTTGKPLFFYDIDEGTTKSITFLPAPDAAYTAHAVIYIGAPSFGNAIANTGLHNLPQDFRPFLRSMVLAKCLSLWGREDVDAARAISLVKRELDELAAEFDDKGASRSTARPRIQSQWLNALASGYCPQG